MTDSITIAYAPDDTLRKLIGEDMPLEKFFTPEKIAACQKMIDEARDAFFETIENDLHTLEHLVEKAPPVIRKEDSRFERLVPFVFNIKGQAEFFGFPLIAHICTHILSYANATEKTFRNKVALVQKLVQMLRLACKERMRDYGGPLKKDVVESLKRD